MPRTNSNKLRTAQNREEDTPEQREIRLGRSLFGFKQRMKEKEDKGEELTETEKRISERLRGLEEEYNIDPAEAIIMQLEEWCKANKRMPKRNKDYIIDPKTEEERKIREENSLAMLSQRTISEVAKKVKNGEEIDLKKQRALEKYTKLQEEYGTKKITSKELFTAVKTADIETIDALDSVLKEETEKIKQQKNGVEIYSTQQDIDD